MSKTGCVRGAQEERGRGRDGTLLGFIPCQRVASAEDRKKLSNLNKPGILELKQLRYSNNRTTKG